ncbi:alpha/beta hydrolase family protein [candidate division KSB1 bacterium]
MIGSKNVWTILALPAMAFALFTCGQPEEVADEWPRFVSDVAIESSFDKAEQRAKFWEPSGLDGPYPLLVALHTWSGDYRQPNFEYLDWCQTHRWALIHPDFRGRNDNPEATGSAAALRDVKDAVEFARRHAPIDEDRIYLVGASGGGFMTLLTASTFPEIWAGASAWVPISDLAAWYQESTDRNNRYASEVAASTGGPPGSSAQADEQYRLRSPINYLHQASGLPMDINAGIHDGHTGSVPISHSLNAFNVLARAGGFGARTIAPEQIDFMVQNEAVPSGLISETDQDQLYGRDIHLRLSAGPARVTIFEGGHEIIPEAALTWLAGQRRD